MTDFNITDSELFIYESASSFVDKRGHLRKFLSKFEGIDSHVSVLFSLNTLKGTVRGLHRQIEPYAEEKNVVCINGRSFHVIVDGRIDSERFGKKYYFVLDGTERKLLHIPALFFHGYQSLSNQTELLYLIRGSYNPSYSQTVNPLDKNLSIAWPLDITEMSQPDLVSPDFTFYFE